MPALVLAGLLVAGAVAAGVLAGSDEYRIRTVVSTFATAVATGDERGARRLLCAEEAEALDDQSEARDATGADPDAGLEPGTLPLVSAVDVTGDTASAIVTLPGRDPLILDLRREDGWRICASDDEDGS